MGKGVVILAFGILLIINGFIIMEMKNAVEQPLTQHSLDQVS